MVQRIGIRVAVSTCGKITVVFPLRVGHSEKVEALRIARGEHRIGVVPAAVQFDQCPFMGEALVGTQTAAGDRVDPDLQQVVDVFPGDLLTDPGVFSNSTVWRNGKDILQFVFLIRRRFTGNGSEQFDRFDPVRRFAGDRGADDSFNDRDETHPFLPDFLRILLIRKMGRAVFNGTLVLIDQTIRQREAGPGDREQLKQFLPALAGKALLSRQDGITERVEALFDPGTVDLFILLRHDVRGKGVDESFRFLLLRNSCFRCFLPFFFRHRIRTTGA